MVKLGNLDTWNKKRFRLRPHDLMNYDIFISLPHVKRTMKNFWAPVWKDFVINMLFKIVLTKHSLEPNNLPKRQDQLYWSKTFYINLSFSSNIYMFVTWNISKLPALKVNFYKSLSVKYEKSLPCKSCRNLEENTTCGLHTWNMHL